jgi:secretion/DNA translocation related TadE-like protein
MRPAPSEPPRNERGIATVWAVAWIFCCLSLGWLALLLAAGVARQHHLDGSADLVALSAAAELQKGGDPCASADILARDNKVSLDRCQVDGQDVVVTVTDTVQLPLELRARITATARAGPG